MNPESIFVTGNTVIDALHLEIANQEVEAVRAEVHSHLDALLPKDWREVPFVLVTGHRRENFGHGFESICGAIGELAERFPNHRFVYPVHLNPNVQVPVNQLLRRFDNVHLIPPQSYRPFVALMKACHLVLTDSGGVQEEAPGLGKPVLVMRDTTERPEGVDAGTTRLVGAVRERIVDGVSNLLTDSEAYRRVARTDNPYGDGQATRRVIAAMAAYLKVDMNIAEAVR